MVAAVWIPAVNLAAVAAGIDPLRDRPILILSVLEYCLAAAYLAIWRAAPDFRTVMLLRTAGFVRGLKTGRGISGVAEAEVPA